MKNKILEQYEKGKIVIETIEGLQVAPLDEFIKQSADGMLYDLNRSETVILTFANATTWVNDYAMARVIRALKNKIEQLESQLK